MVQIYLTWGRPANKVTAETRQRRYDAMDPLRNTRNSHIHELKYIYWIKYVLFFNSSSRPLNLRSECIQSIHVCVYIKNYGETLFPTGPVSIFDDSREEMRVDMILQNTKIILYYNVSMCISNVDRILNFI
jgi:hypothetical protein